MKINLSRWLTCVALNAFVGAFTSIAVGGSVVVGVLIGVIVGTLVEFWISSENA